MFYDVRLQLRAIKRLWIFYSLELIADARCSSANQKLDWKTCEWCENLLAGSFDEISRWIYCFMMSSECGETMSATWRNVIKRKLNNHENNHPHQLQSWKKILLIEFWNFWCIMQIAFFSRWSQTRRKFKSAGHQIAAGAGN